MTIDTGVLYHLTNGTQTPMVEDVTQQFIDVLKRAITKTHKRFVYRQDQRMEKRSRKHLADTERQLGRG